MLGEQNPIHATMISRMKIPKYIKSLFVTIILTGLSLFYALYLNKPQCPESYTQAQVDSSKCIIGANIGFGMLISLTILLAIAGHLIAIILFLKAKKKRSTN